MAARPRLRLGLDPLHRNRGEGKATYEEQPVLAVWNHHGGIGHVAVVVPGVDYTHIAQAGARNFVDEPLSHGFGRIKTRVLVARLT